MNSRKWRKSLRRSIVPIALLWVVMFLGWLALNSQDAGGRPLTILWSADPEMFDPHAPRMQWRLMSFGTSASRCSTKMGKASCVACWRRTSGGSVRMVVG